MKYIHPKRLISVPKRWCKSLYYFFIYHIVPDKLYYKVRFKKKTGKTLNLDNPTTLNEKMHWLKMYYREPIMTFLTDKYKAKEYIRENIGEQYLVPTLAVYKSAKEIDWDTLPDQYVLKCNHDSAGNVICRNKKDIDIKKASWKLDYCLKRNYYHWIDKQWAYKDIPPRIILEPLLQNSNGSPFVDYKFFCYGGKLRYFMYSLGEAEHQVRNVKLDPQKNIIDHFFRKNIQIPPEEIKLPDNIDEMIAIAEEQGKKFPCLRLDMFNVDGHIYIGEFTFYPNGGFINIYSEEYSQKLADMIDINSLKKK